MTGHRPWSEVRHKREERMTDDQKKRSQELHDAAQQQLEKEQAAWRAYDDSAHWDAERKVTVVGAAELTANLEAAGWRYLPE